MDIVLRPLSLSGLVASGGGGLTPQAKTHDSQKIEWYIVTLLPFRRVMLASVSKELFRVKQSMWMRIQEAAQLTLLLTGSYRGHPNNSCGPLGVYFVSTFPALSPPCPTRSEFCSEIRTALIERFVASMLLIFSSHGKIRIPHSSPVTVVLIKDTNVFAVFPLRDLRLLNIQ